MRAAWPLLALALLAALPPAEAALNGPRAYGDTFPFPDDLSGGGFQRMVSGAFDESLGPAAGSHGFFGASATTVSGLTRACWGPGAAQCHSATGRLRIEVPGEASFGLRAPQPVAVEASAAHALALFADFGGERDLNTFDLGRSLVAPVVEGRVAFGPAPTVAGGLVADPEAWYGATALDDETTLEIYDGGTRIATLRGKEDPVFFTGTPAVAPFSAETLVLPFPSGARMEFRPAHPADARVGFNTTRIERLLNDLDEASAGTQDGDDGDVRADTGLPDYRGVLAAVLRGAVVGFSTSEGEGGGEALLVRFTRLEVEASGDQLVLRGRSPLAVQDGHVEGAPRLVGFAFYAMPWWGYALWVAALATWVARLAVRPEKRNVRWDRLRWIGWVAGAVAFLLAFFLWDLETRALWGTSLLAFDARGFALVVVAIIQGVPILAILFATAVPLRLLLRSALFLARQGTFMGLAGPVATLFGFLAGAHLLRGYLDLYVAQVMGSLGG